MILARLEIYLKKQISDQIFELHKKSLNFVKRNYCRLIIGKNSKFKGSSNELKIIDAQPRYIHLVS